MRKIFEDFFDDVELGDNVIEEVPTETVDYEYAICIDYFKTKSSTDYISPDRMRRNFNMVADIVDNVFNNHSDLYFSDMFEKHKRKYNIKSDEIYNEKFFNISDRNIEHTISFYITCTTSTTLLLSFFKTVVKIFEKDVNIGAVSLFEYDKDSVAYTDKNTLACYVPSSNV